MGTPEENNFKTQAWMDGWILLKLIFKKYDWRNWSGFIWLRMKEKWRVIKWGNEKCRSIK